MTNPRHCHATGWSLQRHRRLLGVTVHKDTLKIVAINISFLLPWHVLRSQFTAQVNGKVQKFSTPDANGENGRGGDEQRNSGGDGGGPSNSEIIEIPPLSVTSLKTRRVVANLGECEISSIISFMTGSTICPRFYNVIYGLGLSSPSSASSYASLSTFP